MPAEVTLGSAVSRGAVDMTVREGRWKGRKYNGVKISRHVLQDLNREISPAPGIGHTVVVTKVTKSLLSVQVDTTDKQNRINEIITQRPRARRKLQRQKQSLLIPYPGSDPDPDSSDRPTILIETGI